MYQIFLPQKLFRRCFAKMKELTEILQRLLLPYENISPDSEGEEAK